MATLTYQQIFSMIQGLSPSDKFRLLEDLVVLLRSQTPDCNQRSIFELQGLGKEIWANMDAQKYVDQERDSWNG